jgi:4-azaleucine resistance transporter AzlC
MLSPTTPTSCVPESTWDIACHAPSLGSFSILTKVFDTPNSPDLSPTYRPSPRQAIIRQTASIALAVTPFGVAFGVSCQEAGLNLAETIGFSTLVFAGSAQFAAVGVLAGGGSAAAAVAAGLLLNLRSLAFGVAMAPALRGPRWQRALAAQLMIDESTAIATAQTGRRWQRLAFLVSGTGLFVSWNVATVVGASAFGGAGDLIETAGIDATIPAAFAALLWPRLRERSQRLAAVGGAAIAFATAPLLPAGVPIVGAARAVALARPWKEPR